MDHIFPFAPMCGLEAVEASQEGMGFAAVTNGHLQSFRTKDSLWSWIFVLRQQFLKICLFFLTPTHSSHVDLCCNQDGELLEKYAVLSELLFSPDDFQKMCRAFTENQIEREKLAAAHRKASRELNLSSTNSSNLLLVSASTRQEGMIVEFCLAMLVEL